MRTLLTPQQFNNLVARYSEPHRHYHTLAHITVMFQLAAGHGVRLSIPQQLAIWFHDAVYDPMDPGLNEIKSASLLNSICNENCWLSSAIVERAKSIVMATDGHLSDDHEAQTVIDLDLAGLGFDWATYKMSADNIAKEYCHMTSDRLIEGRRAFIEGMLGRPFIFYTPWGRDFYEHKARKNLETELKILTTTVGN